MGTFVILLLLGIIPGLLYGIYMSTRKSPSVTLVAQAAETGTKLEAVGKDAYALALLENWIKSPNGIPQEAVGHAGYS